MKQGIHPENYRPVVFKDMSNGDMFLTKSTCKTSETIPFDIITYKVRTNVVAYTFARTFAFNKAQTLFLSIIKWSKVE